MVADQESNSEEISMKLEKKVEKVKDKKNKKEKKIKDNKSDVFELQNQKKEKDPEEKEKGEEEEEEEEKPAEGLSYRERLHFDLTHKKCKEKECECAPDNCSGRGECINGGCYCYEGYYGDKC